MNVNFRTALGEELTLTVDPSDTITKIKELLSDQISAALSHINLFYQSYQLRDDLAIEELNLAEDDFIGIRVHKRPIIRDVQSDDQNVINLMTFGFSRDASMDALKSSNNNFNQALELLLNSPQGSDENIIHDNNRNNTSNNNDIFIPADNGDPIERLVSFSGFDRSIVVQVYESFHHNENETRVYLQQMING